jgi:hypothetical protein
VDYLGRSAETGIFQIELRPTVASTMPAIGRWALIGLNTLAILVAVLIAIFGSLALGNRLRRQLLSRFTVEISNEGNLRNRYNLRAEAEPGALSLEFQLQGAALPTQSVAIAPAPELGPEAEPIAAIAEPTPPPASGQATGSGPSIGAVKNTGAFKTFQRGSGILSAVAGFLNAVAGLLPAGAAASLRSTATNLQQGQSVSYEIDRADAKVKMVQHASTNTAQAVAGEPSGPTPAPTATGAPPRTIARGAPAAARGRRPSLTETWAVTPYVEAGEKLSLQLCAKPLKSTRTQTYGIRILSRLAEGPEPAPVNEVGDIKVAGLTRLQRLQPFSLALVMLAIAAGLTALLIRLWGA